MSTRTVTVTVVVETMHRAEYEIDSDDYADWLDGAEDTDATLTEYLEAGDTSELIATVYDRSMSEGRHEVWDSHIEEVIS